MRKNTERLPDFWEAFFIFVWIPNTNHTLRLWRGKIRQRPREKIFFKKLIKVKPSMYEPYDSNQGRGRFGKSHFPLWKMVTESPTRASGHSPLGVLVRDGNEYVSVFLALVLIGSVQLFGLSF
jgi:hypothetical protein